MISDRFGIIISILLAVALIPTIIHNYVGTELDDGLRVRAISTTLAKFSSNATNRRSASWVKDTFDSYDWLERDYIDPGGKKILFFVARSYDLKRLYHHPEIAILRGIDLKKEKITQLREMPHIPVHVLKSQTETGIAAYVLLYDGQFIKYPIRQQILTSVKLLFSYRKPMTLFFVYDATIRSDVPLEKTPAADILFAAVKSFISQKTNN